MKVVAIIQARTGSTRLPGKVLADVGGKTMLARVTERLQRASSLNELLVATTDLPADDLVVAECRKYSVSISRGDQEDVLDRYYRAAQLAKADVIVRITSDCPLIDPEITDKTVSAFLEATPDYAANTLVRTYPRGLDTEVFSMEALARAWREAAIPYQRAHVTPYFYENPSKFRLVSVSAPQDLSEFRWTVDTPEDLEFVRGIYQRFEGRVFGWRDVLTLLEREPELTDLNRLIAQKALHEG